MLITKEQVKKEIDKLFDFYSNVRPKLKEIKALIADLKTAPINTIPTKIEELEKKLDNVYQPKRKLVLKKRVKMIGKIQKTKNRVKELLKEKKLSTYELYEKLVEEGVLQSEENNPKEYSNFRGIVSQMYKVDKDIDRTEDRRGAPWKLAETKAVKMSL